MKEKVMDKNKKKIVKKKDIEKILKNLSISALVSLFSCSSVHLSDTAVSITDCVPSNCLNQGV